MCLAKLGAYTLAQVSVISSCLTWSTDKFIGMGQRHKVSRLKEARKHHNPRCIYCIDLMPTTDNGDADIDTRIEDMTALLNVIFHIYVSI